MKILYKIIEFEWDQWNVEKNRASNKVMPEEIEQAFFDTNKVLLKSSKIIFDNENRLIMIGKTKTERLLFIVFTLREGRVRVISARDLNSKEGHLYEETT